MRRLFAILKRTSWYLLWAALGFVVGAAALYIHTVRSGPPLEVLRDARCRASAAIQAKDSDEVGRLIHGREPRHDVGILRLVLRNIGFQDLLPTFGHWRCLQ